MKKFFKIFGIFVGALVLLLVALALVLPFIIDPNDYKDDITQAVREATGRELTIAGNMELSVFPWLGLEINDVTLGNAPGFGKEPFATLDQAEVRVKLLPLFSREVEVGKVVINGLEVQLERRADGSTNWDDLLAGPDAGAEAPAETAGQGAGLAGLKLEGVEINDARLVYTDAGMSRQFRVAPLNLTIGAFGGGEPFPVHLDADFSMSNPQLAAQVVFDASVELALEAQRYRLHDGKLLLSVGGSPVPLERVEAEFGWELLQADLAAGTAQLENGLLAAHGAEVTLQAQAAGLNGKPSGSLAFRAPAFTPGAEVLRYLQQRLPEKADPALLMPLAAEGSLQFDLGADTAAVDRLTLRAGPLEARLEAQGSDIGTATPQVSGHLAVAEFSPTRLLVALGREALVTADQNALSRATLDTGFAWNGSSASLEPLTLEVDQTEVTGRLAVANIEKRALAFDLAVDAIDVDRYLPPARDKAPAQAAGGALDEVALPVEPVRDLNLNGHLRIGELQAFGLASRNIEIGVHAGDGRLRVHPARAQLYGGEYRGDIRYDVSGAVPDVSLDEHLAGVQIGKLLTDLFGLSRFSGTANVDVALTAAGGTVGDLRRTLDGEAAVALRDGALEGASLWDAIAGAYAQLKGKQPDSGNGGRTPITELSLSAQVRDGVAHNEDLKARVPFLAVTGKGTVDLVRETLDYHLRARVLGTPKVEGLDNMGELEGLTIPIRIRGGFSDFSIRPDVGEALKARAAAELEAAKTRAKAEAERRRREAEQRAQRELEQKKEEAKKELGDKLKDIFD